MMLSEVEESVSTLAGSKMKSDSPHTSLTAVTTIKARRLSMPQPSSKFTRKA